MKIEKLELRHLVGYLPYGLKFLSPKHRLKFGEQIILTSRGMSLCDDGSLNIEFLYDDDLIFSNEMKTCKLILRPLSDLTKEIEVNGEKFVPIERVRNDYSGFFFETNPELLIKSKNTNMYISLNWTIEFQQKLYEWHFDIHGLIEKELAIDINTLEP